jgi:putative endonuclease
MKTKRQILGSWGERLAADFLETMNYTILERNVRTPYGELDLVAQVPEEGGLTVFIEVKTRSSAAFGLPEQAVDRHKQEHMHKAALHYLQSRPDLGENWRFDVIAIERRGKQEPLITIFENAFGDGG